MSTNHTPTPWRVTTTAYGRPLIESSDGTEICKLFSYNSEGYATADHIVRCVNAHDELVAALEYALSLLEGYPDSATDPICTAIARAKGEA
jgi:hypothetical protein